METFQLSVKRVQFSLWTLTRTMPESFFPDHKAQGRVDRAACSL